MLAVCRQLTFQSQVSLEWTQWLIFKIGRKSRRILSSRPACAIEWDLASTRAHTHMITHTYTHTQYTHTYTYTHIHAYIYTHTYTRKHTHTYILSLSHKHTLKSWGKHLKRKQKWSVCFALDFPQCSSQCFCSCILRSSDRLFVWPRQASNPTSPWFSLLDAGTLGVYLHVGCCHFNWQVDKSPVGQRICSRHAWAVWEPRQAQVAASLASSLFFLSIFDNEPRVLFELHCQLSPRFHLR